MKKIGLIVKREFLTRVRKKSFIIMTILGPILSAAIFVLPAYFAMMPDENRTVTVLDEPGLMHLDRGKENLKFRYLPPKKFNMREAMDFFDQSGDYAFLYIPINETSDPDFLAKNTVLFRKGDINLSVEAYINKKLETYIQNEKLKAVGVQPELIGQTKTSVSVRTVNLESEDKESSNMAGIKMGIGYVGGFMVYLFVFLYGAQVMRGVIEEKTSRIVEVIISSVKPFQLMAGKIIGLAAVALVQFIIWVIFGVGLYLVAAIFILGDSFDASQVAQMQALPQEAQNSFAFDLFHALNAIDFTYILSAFLFYFMFGYLLYAAVFAAIGSAVDKESDTQQFMLPVSLPLFAAIIVLMRAVDNPDGPIAFWFSMIPFTSPVVMMARIPFGVPVWQLVVSMISLLATFVLMTWFAGRIYRTGILLYGKKPKLKELLKWVTYKN